MTNFQSIIKSIFCHVQIGGLTRRDLQIVLTQFRQTRINDDNEKNHSVWKWNSAAIDAPRQMSNSK